MRQRWRMRSGSTALAVVLAMVMLAVFSGCRKRVPEEADLRAAMTPTPARKAVTPPAASPLEVEGRLEVVLSAGRPSPARLLLLVDRSVAASFSIESLKQSISTLLDRLPADLPLGIRVFPGGGGEASTLLSPVATGERMALKLKVLELAPGGTGSFSRAMLEASSDFIGDSAGSRIILIAPPTQETDAERDPCATARTLRRMSEGIVVDVVEILPSYLGQVLPGFTQGILSCVATEGGGRFVQVSDIDSADTAIWSMVETARPNLTVDVALSTGVALTGDSAREGGTWGATLYPSDSLSPIRSTNALPVSWAVPPGDYSLRVWYRDLSGAVNNLRVASGTPVVAAVNLHAATLEVAAVDTAGRAIAGDFREADCSTRWELTTEAGELAGRGCVFPATATVRAGTYTIRLLSDRYAEGAATVEILEAGAAKVTLVEGSQPTPTEMLTETPTP